ncbi:uncharacterized protein CIMG_09756 [Coccidioides immitis RS]|uniref:Zn(2)-C6 fungal-type domain-containing protein n=2 Tax=Coccidioides immitis TaxID=5501 RepID=J3K331_COCIM|nr:uncharacterized protein CIMG_09756 [Coccidioides immitis RS]EAS28552.3 hypothetical protein CIMG_09756 [Coccidioides immitis RS]KMP02655.1 hypothetical protein CIRG_02347 [Coccidioides immitis RMSCC 2394]
MSPGGSTATAAPPPALKSRRSAKQGDGLAPAPRKRRRRAVGSGAADDCFTCADRQVSCDRRRPYCTQCLDLGRRCSGYKTTLTWGVGVASRGKLRGLSLPISGSQKVTAPVSQTATRKQAPRSVPHAKDRNDVTGLTQARDEFNGFISSSVPLTPTSSLSSPASWVSTVAAPDVPITSQTSQSPVNIASFQQSSYTPSENHTEYTPSQSVYSNAGLGTTSIASFDNTQFHPTAWTHLATSHPHVTPQSPPVSDQPVPLHANISRKRVICNYSRPAEDEISPTSSSPPEAHTSTPGDNYESVSSQSYPIHQPFWNQMVGQTPRMRYLIGYYMEVIAPVIVAFDTPTSPFRLYMIELAKTSDTLQHAIATLSLSNLRQRRKNWGLSTGKTLPSRRSCQAHCRLTDRSMTEGFGLLSPDEQMKEETLHKAIVINSVNAQLADPIARRSDALLATLLVLSIFHMCDTGFASFKSQFAGVRKLFALRKNSRNSNLEATKWFMRMFTWFDTMTAAVNDRDSQLGAEFLDLVTQTGDEWALENLAGCESRLFRMVAQLSRLNQLSQMKPVEPNEFVEKPVATVTPPPSMLHYPTFSSPIYSREGFVPFPSDMPFNAYQVSDPRTEFWQEWRAMRQRLESWRMDPASTTAPRPTTPSHTPTSSAHFLSSSGFTSATPPATSTLAHVPQANLPDVSNISESFRYAGLLYLERLANPNIPSTHARIQNLVYGALHYITAVQSDVFLLWPLFITGAECVFEADRQIIRQRCCDIQKDSGFVNNLSCLQLLEKIWASDSKQGSSQPFPDVTNSPSDLRTATKAEHPGTSAGPMGPPCATRELVGGEGFKWRRIIDSEKMTQEYIVV